jgi:hypothetical protein
VSPRDQVTVGVVVEGEDEVGGGHRGSHPVYTGYGGGEGEQGASQGVENARSVQVLSVREDEEAVGGGDEDVVAEPLRQVPELLALQSAGKGHQTAGRTL